MRAAWEELDEQELKQLLLDGLEFDDIPDCTCPIKQFPNSMTTVFCNTKCWQPCDNFTSFSFITDRCPDIQCSHDAPCAVCLSMISDYKVLMKGIKAIWDRRGWTNRIKSRVKKFCDKNNQTWKILKEKREARSG